MLNRVPSSSPMPFGWTVNPYRGCSHACTYCLVPDTPVLTADGRSRPIGELRPGDEVVGTLADGAGGAGSSAPRCSRAGRPGAGRRR